MYLNLFLNNFQKLGPVTRVSSFTDLSSAASSASACAAHVRVPVLDAIAILQLRRADAELDSGTLGAQMVPPVLTADQAVERLHQVCFCLFVLFCCCFVVVFCFVFVLFLLLFFVLFLFCFLFCFCFLEFN